MIETTLSAVYYMAVLILLLVNAILWLQDRNANRTRSENLRQLLMQTRSNRRNADTYTLDWEIETELTPEQFADKIREMLDKVENLDLPQTDQSATTPTNQAPTNRNPRKSTQPKADTTAAPRRTRKVAQQADK